MCRKLLFVGTIILLLVGAAANPVSVRAEDDTPSTPELVKPPWITGKNPDVSLSAGEEEELNPSGIIGYWEGVEVPLLAPPPSYVDLAPHHAADNLPAVPALAIPQLYQDPADVTCGAAALGMALEFLSLNGEGQAPSQAALVGDLKNSGLLYETGTGVEELAYLARGNGYRGTTAFHNWTLEQLAEQLHLGKPVVVSLGVNGEDQPGHFVTLTGFSADGQWVSYNDPILGAQTVPADDFLYQWNLQGNSGLVVQKQPLSKADDPMLPWMGLFGALSTLAVLVKSNPNRTDLKETLRAIQGMLSDPRRKGLGGALMDSSGGGGNNSSPPYRAPAGYKWKKTFTPKHGWKDVEVIKKVEVPNMVRTWAVVKVNRWMEKVPVYKTVKVDRGRWAYRTVTKYRTERYRTSERYRVKKSYWYRRNGRLYRGTRYEWKTRTVVKTRKVAYRDRERYWIPKIVTEQRFVRNRQIEHRDPVYGWREEKRGTKIVERTKSTRAWKPVGTEVKWKLERNPKLTPTPIPTPPNPTLTPTPWLTSTPPATPAPTATPLPITTPTSQCDWLYSGISTPAPVISPAINNQISEVDQDFDWLDWLDGEIKDAKTTKKIVGFTYMLAKKTNAASKIDISQADDMLKIFGPRAARSTLGFNPYTNWIKPANASNVFQGIDDLALKSATSGGTTLGLALNIAANSVDYSQGEIDRFEYAAAMTVDTGITVGSALLAGAIAGFVGGALTGAVVGLGIGAVPGAIIGGIVGALTTIGITQLLNKSGAREKMIDSVADMYQDWVQ